MSKDYPLWMNYFRHQAKMIMAMNTTLQLLTKSHQNFTLWQAEIDRQSNTHEPKHCDTVDHGLNTDNVITFINCKWQGDAWSSQKIYLVKIPYSFLVAGDTAVYNLWMIHPMWSSDPRHWIRESHSNCHWFSSTNICIQARLSSFGLLKTHVHVPYAINSNFIMLSFDLKGMTTVEIFDYLRNLQTINIISTNAYTYTNSCLRFCSRLHVQRTWIKHDTAKTVILRWWDWAWIAM
jgi:hypothetical protein